MWHSVSSGLFARCAPRQISKPDSRSPESRWLIEQMNDVILEEINAKAIEFIDESSPIVRKTATANFKVIGPKFGKMVNAVAKRIKEMTSAEVVELDRSGTFSTDVNGNPITVV